MLALAMSLLQALSSLLLPSRFLHGQSARSVYPRSVLAIESKAKASIGAKSEEALGRIQRSPSLYRVAHPSFQLQCKHAVVVAVRSKSRTPLTRQLPNIIANLQHLYRICKHFETQLLQ